MNYIAPNSKCTHLNTHSKSMLLCAQVICVFSCARWLHSLRSCNQADTITRRNRMTQLSHMELESSLSKSRLETDSPCVSHSVRDIRAVPATASFILLASHLHAITHDVFVSCSRMFCRLVSRPRTERPTGHNAL